MQQLALTPAKLYDGLDTGFYAFTCHLPLPEELSLRVLDCQPFDQLAARLPPVEFAQLLREGSFRQTSGVFATYVGTDELPLCYHWHPPWLLVLASGEYQPARYKIYLEGGWQTSFLAPLPVSAAGSKSPTTPRRRPPLVRLMDWLLN